GGGVFWHLKGGSRKAIRKARIMQRILLKDGNIITKFAKRVKFLAKKLYITREKRRKDSKMWRI
ncbi:MAG: hypothetical protein OEZ02_11375, partial [Anaerolineae bacterium]|nr:hypothetical protein [Anaerolineae bacterium]